MVGDVTRGAVAETVTAQDPWYPVAPHRGLVAVPQAVWGQAWDERCPRTVGHLFGLGAVHAFHRHWDAGKTVA